MPRSENHKVVFMGNTAVGKTSIIHQFIYNAATADHQPTIGIDFYAKPVTDGDTTVKMQIWDTAGQEKFHSLIPSYVRSSTVAVMVYDITSKQTFDDLAKWYTTVTNIAEPAMIVVGNKCDLESEREVSIEQAKKYANDIHAQYIETSARTPINVQELFTLIAKIPIPTKAASNGNPAIVQPVETVDIAAPSQQNQNNNNNNGGGCGC